METLTCNMCGRDIHDFKRDLFHVTAIANGKLDTHVHLCRTCFNITIPNIPNIGNTFTKKFDKK